MRQSLNATTYPEPEDCGAAPALSGKARTLEGIAPLVARSVVPPLLRFSLRQWRTERQAVLERIQRAFAGQRLAVRSSAFCEDGPQASRAGEFLSLLDIPADAEDTLAGAIDDVAGAMAGDAGRDEFFVQRMVARVRLSGVVFTRDQDTFAPYYVVNYDSTTRRTNTVTSGTSNDLTTLVLHRGRRPRDPDLARLIEAVAELEALFRCDCLDVEFAIDRDGRVHILQVRRLADKKNGLVIPGEMIDPDDAALANHLRKCEKKLAKLMSPHPHLAGRTTCFGVMPDWNPAEIIGIRPRKLALSLYRELIMDHIWADQRYNYGYRDVRSVPLMVTFLGIPYIDIRASFNSFIPRSLSGPIAHKLADHYLSRLHQRPELHDKIEFDIVFSCAFPGLDRRLRELVDHGFNESEIRRIEFALLELTNNIIAPGKGLFERDMDQLAVLEQRYAAVTDSDLSVIGKIFWLTEDCKRYGTLPFAGVARSAFVAMQLLRSFVGVGVLSREDFDAYLNSLSTVSRQVVADIAALQGGEMDKSLFLSRYGHLRPGTYDILSPRYDENYEVYFGAAKNGLPEPGPQAAAAPFAFPRKVLDDMDALLEESGFLVKSGQVLDFIKRATEGREMVKFVFSRNISRILVLVEEMGARYGFCRDDLSYLDIRTVLDLYADLDHRDLADILGRDMETNRAYHQLTRNVRLPHLLLDPGDVYEFDLPAGQPNFVTISMVEADVVPEEDFGRGIAGRIAFIASADPGYDWIFAKKPAGLVTMYGGANSHMAIRCAELGLPAVIGAGEANFRRWMTASRLWISCLEQKVRVIA